MTLAHRNLAPLRAFLRRAAPAICCLAGFLYPLAGIILFVVFKVRCVDDRILTWAPLLGTILSMVLYVIDFASLVIAQG